MRYSEPKFSVAPGQSTAYRDNFDRIFKRRRPKAKPSVDPRPRGGADANPGRTHFAGDDCEGSHVTLVECAFCPRRILVGSDCICIDSIPCLNG